MADMQARSTEDGKSFLEIKEFLTIVVKIATALVGFASLFALLGYIIILSFVSDVKLYGLTSFPQEFYKEASVKFFSHMLAVSGRHPISFISVMALFIAFVIIISKIGSVDAHSNLRKSLRIVSWAGILIVILLTLRLDVMSTFLSGLSDAKEVVLFHLSVPVLCMIFTYLAFNFGRFTFKTYGAYYLMVVLFWGLLLAIPIAYGSAVFDVEVFPVEGVDFGDSPNINSLKDLKTSINTKKGGALFFLMGHTSDKEVFFDWNEANPPAKMMIIDRSLIKYLKVTKADTLSLRALLDKPRGIRPISASNISDLPEQIQKAIDGISLGGAM